MNDQTQNAGATGSAEDAKTPAPPKEIIRGRMPVGVVFLARFGQMSGEATKVKADAFGTTVGKIDDIAKGRNFAYVKADFKPTEQQKADAKAWLERHPGGKPEKLLAELEALSVASADEAAAFEAARAANRGQSDKTKDGEPANAGGGNRRGKKADKAPADAAKTGEALLS
jgi:hypothetical protein